MTKIGTASIQKPSLIAIKSVKKKPFLAILEKPYSRKKILFETFYVIMGFHENNNMFKVSKIALC